MQKKEVRIIRRCLDRVIPVRVADKVLPAIEGEYRLKRDSNGNCVYEHVGDRDVRAYIESFATGCSLKSILDRCALLPVHDKIQYLNQTEQSVSADLTSIPKDGTAAQILLMDLKRNHPDLVDKINSGMSFDEAFNAVFVKNAESDVRDPVHPVVENVQKEGV